MARITKQAHIEQLEARIIELEAELATARSTISHAVEAMEQADAELEAARQPTRRVQRAGYVAPTWQAERAAQMAAARALAMKVGRTVKVEVAA